MRWSRNHFMRTLCLAAMVFALVFVSVGMASAAPFDENRPKVGDKASNFEIQGFKLSDLKGKKNLVMIFYRGHF